MADEENVTPNETLPYRSWQKYWYGWFQKSGFLPMAQQCRRYFQGKQYSDSVDKGALKPTMNICKEGADKFVAKTLETNCSLEFTADKPDVDLTRMDEFYEFQMKLINNDEFLAQLCERGFVDGVGVGITCYDRDEAGSGSKYRGYLKREVPLFENTFWSNPFKPDPQDQRWWGFREDMEISAVKELLANEYEGEEGSKEYKEKLKLLVPDDFYDGSEPYDEEDIDSRVVKVFTRFFRKNGEVAYEVATRYCNLFKHPHALNPDVNEKMLEDLKKEADESASDPKKAGESEDAHVEYDYAMDPARYTLFEKAVKETREEKGARMRHFWRYPVVLYRPMPIPKSILGTSSVSLLIPNQNLINLTFFYIAMIMQYHAMPVWIVKKDAFPGQNLDNSPNKVLVDCSPITSNVQWGATRISAGDSINSNLITIGDDIMNDTRSLNGFADLISNTNSGDSGYLFQQKQQQQNLTLEQPQRRLWKCEEELAKTDLLFFQHYVEEASFFERVDDGEYDYQSNAKTMASQIADSGAAGDIPVQDAEILQDPNPIPRNREVTVTSDLFDGDFFVTVEAVQGLATSVLSEGEEYDKVMTSIMTGNTDAEFLKVYLAGNRNMHFKTKQRVRRALDAYMSSDIRRKDEEIAQLKQTCQTLIANLKSSQQGIQLANMQNKAQQQAFNEQNQTNMAVLKGLQDQQKAMETEGQKKSQNAKGGADGVGGNNS